MAAWIEDRQGTLTVRWKFRGKYGRRKVPDKRTARALINEIEACHAFGQHYRPRSAETRRDQDLTDVIVAHLEDVQRIRSSKTTQNSKTALKRFIVFLRASRPRGRLTADLVTRKALEGFHDRLTSDGLSDATARHYVTRVSLFWQWAERSIEHGDDFARYNPPRLPALRASAIVFSPTWAQLDTLIAQERARAAGSPQVRLMVLQRYTGLRVKQAGRLRWDDVDLQGGRMRVRPELGKSALEKRGRVVPVSSHLIEELATWGRREGALIDSHGRAEHLHLESIRKAVVRAWKRSEIDPSLYQGQTSHAFRKAFTSELARRRSERWAVEMLLGRSTGMGGDVYTDPAFAWEAMAHAVGLVTRIGEESDIDFHRNVSW